MQDKTIVSLLKNDLNVINSLLSEYLLVDDERESRLNLIGSKLETIKKEFDLLSDNLSADGALKDKADVKKQIEYCSTDNCRSNKKDFTSNANEAQNIPLTEASQERVEKPTVENQPMSSDVKDKETQSPIVENVYEQVKELSEKKKMKVYHNAASHKKEKTLSNSSSDGEQSMLNDKHQSNSPILLADKIVKHKVDDVRSLIGINDRFLFIRELFNASNDEYNNLIEVINKSHSYSDAYKYINENKTWDMEDTIVQDFINICKRKF